MEFTGKKVLVAGMGRSGIASAEILMNIGAAVDLYDMKESAGQSLSPALFEGAGTCFFGKDPENVGSYDYLILSPGISPETGFAKEAREAGVTVLGELELSWQLSRGTSVAITGTNGKTTTTALTGEIFRNAGKDTRVVGNIGVAAVADAASASEDTWLITEVSSFQLETIHDFHPVISSILNITPDHMDRHKTLENYAGTKARVFENQTSEDYFIVNGDDPESMKLVASCKAQVIPFSRKTTPEPGCFAADGWIWVSPAEGVREQIFPVEDLQIPGNHNLENALAAVAMTYFAGISPEIIAKTLREFQGVAHRMEFAGTVNGVRFVNDSKGTNPDASIKAIEATNTPLILIAGGYDKGSVYDEFIAAFGHKVKGLVLMGKTAPKIREAAEKAGFTSIIMASDMEDSVKKAFEIAESGDTVLLSPACASWDMYRCFEDRGEDFKTCVKKLASLI
ncbi:MAG: UDP-N-acetylmuramoyl-L-alanine--D-glutamate ligase [Clostridiales bacterium]|nr:UDP-N-acetylmuramoyl-L-alanine--D-glutamate ligase [Clostridiales bacterium]